MASIISSPNTKSSLVQEIQVLEINFRTKENWQSQKVSLPTGKDNKSGEEPDGDISDG